MEGRSSAAVACPIRKVVLSGVTPQELVWLVRPVRDVTVTGLLMQSVQVFLTPVGAFQRGEAAAHLPLWSLISV